MVLLGHFQGVQESFLLEYHQGHFNTLEGSKHRPTPVVLIVVSAALRAF